MPKCCADRSNHCRDIVIFKLFGCRPPRSWISLDLKFVTDQTVTRAELRWNRWNCGWDMAIFQFFKMAAAAMLDFGNYEVLTMGRIISAELRHHAKFRGDWSNRCHDISILHLSRWWQPQSWIVKIFTGSAVALHCCKAHSKSIGTRNRKHRRAAAKPAACARNP